MTEVLYSIRSISRLLLLIVAHILLAIFISFISFFLVLYFEYVFLQMNDYCQLKEVAVSSTVELIEILTPKSS